MCWWNIEWNWLRSIALEDWMRLMEEWCHGECCISSELYSMPEQVNQNRATHLHSFPKHPLHPHPLANPFKSLICPLRMPSPLSCRYKPYSTPPLPPTSNTLVCPPGSLHKTRDCPSITHPLTLSNQYKSPSLFSSLSSQHSNHGIVP